MNNDLTWAVEQSDKEHAAMLTAIKDGDDFAAGVRAGHVAVLHNAINRVNRGESKSLLDDPMYGRFFNINEYFANPRQATTGDVVVNYER